MIKAAVIDNGIVGLRDCFKNNAKVQYYYLEVSAGKIPDFSGYDLLVVPNGTDQVAMLRNREAVEAFLNAGKMAFCFDGWFTGWVPGNQWVMDNSKKTIDVRYFIKEDRYGLFDGVELDAFIWSNGISGWWSCGYIEAAPEADVVLQDTWQRPVMVLDQKSTPGTLFLTASGPLGDNTYATTDDPASMDSLARFYHNLIDKLVL